MTSIVRIQSMSNLFKNKVLLIMVGHKLPTPEDILLSIKKVLYIDYPFIKSLFILGSAKGYTSMQARLQENSNDKLPKLESLIM